jgi:hypothetical protein
VVETGALALVNVMNRAGKNNAVHDILEAARQRKRLVWDPILIEKASRLKSEEASGEGKVNDGTPEAQAFSGSLVLMKTHEICSMFRWGRREENII